MTQPRLRTTERHPPPYPLNEFPTGFAETIGKRIIYLLATRPKPNIAGSDWEQTFAHGINAEWSPTNTGLDDVSLGTCAWGAKTLQTTKPFTVTTVRIIAGRNSPDYSYGERPEDPDILGSMALGIWNERVNNAKSNFRHVRNVVLLKGTNWTDFSVFEFTTPFFEPTQYHWKYNKGKNLEGFDNTSGEHRFTWQPHGAQFTIKQPVPADRLRFRIEKIPPPTIDSIDEFLDRSGYDDSWVSVVD